MKTLTLLPIVGALTLFGSAFFELWTAPGLENLPTYDDIRKKPGPISSASAGGIEGICAISSEYDYQPEGVSFDAGGRPSITLSSPNARMLNQSAKAAARKAPVQRRVQLPTPPASPDPFAKHRVEPYRASKVGWRLRN